MDYLKYTIKAAQGTISIGGKVIDAYNMEMLVNQIYDQIYDVYFDIARSHLKAAEESMKASQKSNHPEQEFFAAIHHLYDSFEVLQPLLTKTRTYKSLIFFTTTEDVVKDKIKIYNPCFKICALIFMLYHILEEKNNANDWENKFYFYKEKVQDDNRNKYGGSFWVGKRESCKCIYTCWEYHHMDWDKTCLIVTVNINVI
ncbi:hypothetical protein [Clostridium sp. AM58-1XD]|uniref:hypothetical protein n=1 Tax=Clostridium sp. AM58-1XD TaxID=2292307 RepID=UPI000E4B7D46|nr:hypothetical protein [Clostridium sp. AM58-1XD]RGY99434.1 hypothetical protein DXA13_07955 [Clostridium sp. AM58-1XD]